MRITRWGLEHGALVLCAVGTAGTLGHVYYRKKNDIPYKIKLVESENGLNDPISYVVYNLYQLKEKYYPTDANATKELTLEEKRIKRGQQLQSDLDTLRKKYGVYNDSINSDKENNVVKNSKAIGDNNINNNNKIGE